MVDFKDQVQFETWLQTQPCDVSSVLAARAALRVFPLIQGVFAAASRKKYPGYRRNIALPVIRAQALSWVAGTYPTHDSALRIAARTAARTAADAADTVAHTTAEATAEVTAYATLAAAYAPAYAVRTAAYAADTVARTAVYAVARTASAATARAAADATHAAADAATDAATDAAVDAALVTDAKLIEAGKTAAELSNRGLWPDDIPEWVSENWQKLKAHLLAANEDWQVWTDWYEARLKGRPAYPNLSPERNEKLEVAVATIPDEKWEQRPTTLNAHIKKLIQEFTPVQTLKPVFISYSAKNAGKAKWIGGLIEAAGYPVFAQYNDMPPGSNFVEEMKRGLEELGCMIALLSPAYEASDHCQAEWNAAYNMDPSGNKRLIIPVMVEETILNPLRRQIVYIPAFKISHEETKAEILKALAGSSAYAKRLRPAIAYAASPAPFITEEIQIDAGPNKALDTPDVDDDLFDLADRQLKLLRVGLGSMPDGTPNEVLLALKEYQAELMANGVQPSTGTLADMAAIVHSAINATGASNFWYSEGLTTTFERFFENHDKIMEHYPLISVRIDVYEQAEVDEKAASGSELSDPMDELLSTVRKAHASGLSTDEFLRVIENREQIMSIYASAPPDSSEMSDDGKISVKKRGILQDAGFVDKAIERIEKSAKIADTDSGKAFLDGLRKVASALWKFIG